MKNKITNYYLILYILILLLASLSLVFINYINKSKKEDYYSEKISNLTISYNSSIEKYRLLTKYVFNESIKNDLILSLFERGVNSEGEVRRLYKGLLYKELEPLYQRLKKDGIRQVHFHLKNSESYIRFYKPNKYGDNLSNLRETVNIANKENKIVSNFETGRVISGFRNVFPLNFKNEHLGSVELSVSTKTMLESIFKLDNRGEFLFLLNKNIVYPKLFDSQKSLYETSIINSNYLLEDRNSSLADSPKKLSPIAIKINKKISTNKELKMAMAKGNKYMTFVEIDNISYDVILIPMIGVTKKIEGYLIEYKKSENIPILVKMDIYTYLFIIFGMLLLMFLVYIIEKKSKTLDKQKEWFKSITDNLGEGLYVMNLKAEITYINPSACKILGYEANEIIGKNAHSLFHSHSFNNNLKQEDCPIFLGAINEDIFNTEKEYFLTSDGREISVSLRSKLIKKEHGLSEIVTSFSDITIQKKIKKESALLRKALESSINCIVITDKDANVQWANPAFEKLTGFKINEISGKNPKEFISSKKQTKEFYSQMWETILNKKPWKGELINKKKDGTLYDEELIITPVLDENNEIINFIAIKQDISHRKIIALKKQEKEKLFYQQSKMASMGEMLANIAHQWRQPLSVISTAATGIKVQKSLDILNEDELIHTMDSINNSAQFLSQTIEDFRGFFNPKNNTEKEFLISSLIDKSLNLVKAQFSSMNIDIIKDIEDISVVSLENELVQVLVNILNNSRDVLIKIENKRRLLFINAKIKNNTFIIEIKDNGKGIPLDVIDKVFEPYFTTKHQSQGTGIGLYMSEKIISSHLNGILKVENETYTYEGSEYTGAKFRIEISLN